MLKVNNLVGFGVGGPVQWFGDLSSTTYAGNSLVSAQDTKTDICAISPKGNKFYVFGGDAGKVYEYNLITPFDITTIAYVGTHATALITMASIGYIYDFSFNYEGTKLFANGDQNGAGDGRIAEFALSTPWDISTISYTSTKSITAQIPGGNITTGGHMSYDGTRYYAFSLSDHKIYQYALSTPWLISTMSYASKSFDTTITDGYGLYLANDGSSAYLARFSGSILQYNLSTPWDISTASLHTTFTNPASNCRSVCFDEEGLNVYYTIGDPTNRVYQYSINV